MYVKYGSAALGKNALMTLWEKRAMTTAGIIRQAQYLLSINWFSLTARGCARSNVQKETSLEKTWTDNGLVFIVFTF